MYKNCVGEMSLHYNELITLSIGAETLGFVLKCPHTQKLNE
jgi:hypothetical protein